MEQIVLNASQRETLGKKVKVLRLKGEMPAVLYGKNFKNQSLSINQSEFEKVFAKAGGSTLVDLKIGGNQPLKVLIHEPQKDPINDQPLHVDLYKVDMKEEIHTEIPLDFVGTSAAVEELEGNLITNKDALEVECLPDKLVSKIDVDISVLKTLEDLIHIKDLVIPEGIKVLDDPEEIVVQVTPPRSEEELEAMEQETSAEAEKAQIEGIEAEAEKEKAEKEAERAEEEGAEQTTPPAEPQKPEENKE